MLHAPASTPSSDIGHQIGPKADPLASRGSFAVGLIMQADRTLARTALLFLAMVPFSIVGFLLDGRTLDGVNIWLKPMKFQMSIAIFLFTMAAMVPLTKKSWRSTRWASITIQTAVWVSVFEVGYITLQAARGVRSHFATDAFGELMYALMGIGAVLLSLTPISVTLATLFSGDRDPRRSVVRWGLSVGAVAGLVGSAGVGSLLGDRPEYAVAGAGASGLPFVGWSTTGGDLRIAHFVGLHAMQGMFALGIVLAMLKLRFARLIILALGTGWIAATVWLAQVALADQTPWDALLGTPAVEPSQGSPRD